MVLEKETSSIPSIEDQVSAALSEVIDDFSTEQEETDEIEESELQ